MAIPNEIAFYVDFLSSTSSWNRKRNKIVVSVKFEVMNAREIVRFDSKSKLTIS